MFIAHITLLPTLFFNACLDRQYWTRCRRNYRHKGYQYKRVRSLLGDRYPFRLVWKALSQLHNEKLFP